MFSFRFITQKNGLRTGLKALLYPFLIGLASSSLAVTPARADDLCPAAALTQMTRHRVRQGETLASIAARYELLPTTLTGVNPNLGQSVTVGQEILIPPYNGFAVAVASGQTWQTLAERYRVRADLLFEVNGCQARVPNRVFIPGFPGGSNTATGAAELSGYPLPARASVILSYGWQPHPSRDEIVFNSGIALESDPGTAVLTVAEGTVAFAGYQEGYGNLVVVNHRQGLQTRYGNLGEISVALGQRVRLGEPLGTVGGNAAASVSFLYFEVRANSEQGWVAQNPSQYIPGLELQ